MFGFIVNSSSKALFTVGTQASAVPIAVGMASFLDYHYQPKGLFKKIQGITVILLPSILK
jgi:hypothetical protein